MIEVTWFFFLYLIIPLAFILILFLRQKQYVHQYSETDFPKISVLVAARNEEHTILRCLKALNNLDYPKDRLQILIGNDASEDRTAEVVADYIKDKPHFQLINITSRLGNAEAKANVLAHLAHNATGELFFYTDADIAVPTQWIKTMVAACSEDTGIITGVSLVAGNRLFDKMQCIDWSFALALFKVLERINIPVAAMGNNMMVRREAYFSTGGFESMQASIIEDLALFREVINKGWKFKQLYQPEVTAETLPVKNFAEWMQQRKRWMKGAMQLPLYIRLGLAFNLLLYPALIVFIFFDPLAGFILLFSKFILQWLLIIKALKLLKRSNLIYYGLLYDLYSFILYSILAVFYLIPVPVKWKGRSYK